MNLLFGATGLIGNQIVKLLPESQSLITVTRKPFMCERRNHQNIVCDLKPASLEQLTLPSPIENVFACLGTTIKIAGSQQKFYEVDHDLVVNVAKLAKRVGAKKLLVVSAIGADVNSKIFYSRTKGEMERDARLAAQGVEIVFTRPSLLLGDRTSLGQPERLGELVGQKLAPLYSFLFVGPLKKYRPIQAADVAKELLGKIKS